MFSQLLAAATASSARKSQSASNNISSAKPVQSTVIPQKVNSTSTEIKEATKPGNAVKVGKTIRKPESISEGDPTASGSTISNDNGKNLAKVERLKAHQPTPASAKSSVLGKSSEVAKKTVALNPAGGSSASKSIVAANRKKPNFLDILKEAEKVDSDKLKVTVKVRDPKKRPEKTVSKAVGNRASHSPSPSVGNAADKFPTTPAKGRILDSKSGTSIIAKQDVGSRPSGSPATKDGKKFDRKVGKPDIRQVPGKVGFLRQAASPSALDKTSHPVQKARTPAPFARPMEGLLKKRKAAEESDASLDDFIVSDEEEDEEEDDVSTTMSRRGGKSRGPGYDREEIWNLFRRGGRSSNFGYDDDDDNMEASGFDVLREEITSTAHARKEDEMMEEEERRLAEEKKRRKRMKRP
ncbi:SPT2 chromatin protein-domain-containing protein [Lipomyces kononenkoae]|uniref:SPT2 chromatin protein-domain-containing protein n=1 Tax=Lipomyces kononenkoae TaxID=34357 RepID=A0ACC3T090_LIPKO